MPEGIFKHRTQDESKNQGRRFELKFLHEVSQYSKDDHNDNFDHIIIETVDADQAKEKDQWEKNWIGNL